MRPVTPNIQGRRPGTAVTAAVPILVHGFRLIVVFDSQRDSCHYRMVNVENKRLQ